MFQARTADREQTLALIQDINKYLGENPLTEAEIKEAFEKWWDELKTALDTMPPLTTATPPARDPVEMTVEILEHVRAMRPQVQQIGQENQLARLNREYDERSKNLFGTNPNFVLSPTGHVVSNSRGFGSLRDLMQVPGANDEAIFFGETPNSTPAATPAATQSGETRVQLPSSPRRKKPVAPSGTRKKTDSSPT
jgi:hypothetical protein